MLAEYIAMRRLTAMAVMITISAGVCSLISCTAVNCDAPASTSTENPMTCGRCSPASEATTPNNRPKGASTSRNGRDWINPCRKACAGVRASALRSAGVRSRLGSGSAIAGMMDCAHIFGGKVCGRLAICPPQDKSKAKDRHEP